MRGLRATLDLEVAAGVGPTAAGDGQHEQMMALLDDEGMTSVVATNCEQHYDRPLVPGDRLRGDVGHRGDLGRQGDRARDRALRHHPHRLRGRARRPVADAADPAELAAAGEPVATMRFRILKFRPEPGRRGVGPRPGRPAPAAGHHPGQRLLLRGGPPAPAAHPALHRLRHPAPPAATGLCAVPVVRVGHRRGVGPRRALQLRRRPLPPGPGVRLPPAHRPGGAGGGDPAGGRPRRRRPGRRADRDARRGPASSTTTTS